MKNFVSILFVVISFLLNAQKNEQIKRVDVNGLSKDSTVNINATSEKTSNSIFYFIDQNGKVVLYRNLSEENDCIDFELLESGQYRLITQDELIKSKFCLIKD